MEAMALNKGIYLFIYKNKPSNLYSYNSHFSLLRGKKFQYISESDILGGK